MAYNEGGEDPGQLLMRTIGMHLRSLPAEQRAPQARNLWRQRHLQATFDRQPTLVDDWVQAGCLSPEEADAAVAELDGPGHPMPAQGAIQATDWRMRRGRAEELLPTIPKLMDTLVASGFNRKRMGYWRRWASDWQPVPRANAVSATASTSPDPAPAIPPQRPHWQSPPKRHEPKPAPVQPSSPDDLF